MKIRILLNGRNEKTNEKKQIRRNKREETNEKKDTTSRVIKCASHLNQETSLGMVVKIWLAHFAYLFNIR